ncbi:hypothetical protein V8C35DRAFT_199680 [Trichoderma chlorosporum]
MDVPNAAKRSACDRCRSKRVRCPRAGSSTAPCSRCVHAGARCITGAPGNPGRPRKARHVSGTTPEGPAMALGASSPVYWPTPSGTPRIGPDLRNAEVNPFLPVSELTGWFEAGPGSGTTLLNLVDDFGGPVTAPFQHPEHVARDSSLQGNSKLWAALNIPLAEENPVTSTESTLFDGLSSPSQHQALPAAADNLGLLHAGLESPDKLSNYSCLGLFDGLPNPGSTQQLNVGSQLIRFRDKMDQRVAAMGAFFSDPLVVEDCGEKRTMGTEPAVPVAVLLECIKEFTDIIQSLGVVAQPAASDASSHDHQQPMTADPAPWATQLDSLLSSETALLILSGYLALMRLCDSLFHGVCHSFSQMPPEALKSVKVKGVFRIGGVSSLQDMPAKAYAMGIIDIMQSQIQQLERCLGLPAAYCLSGEEAPSSSQVSTLEIFATGDRARLLQAVMEQEDVKAHRGNKSCVQSIRENLQKTVAFFGDQ